MSKYFYYLYVLDEKNRFPNSLKDGNFTLIGVFRHDVPLASKSTLEKELSVQYGTEWYYNAFEDAYYTLDKTKKLGYIKKVF